MTSRALPSRTALYAFGVFLAAFLVRIANYSTAFVGGAPQISPFDEMYHAKRIVYSSINPFRVLDFDPNRGANGAYCPWPPLYDMTAGAAARLSGGATPAGVVLRASWIPPIVASLVAAVIAAWLSRKVRPAAGLLAGIGLAISADSIDRSRLGAIDHHFLEFPLVLGLAAATRLVSRSTTARQAVRNGAILGLALTVTLLVQPALLLGGGLVLVIVLLLDQTTPFPRAAAGFGFLFAAAAVFLYRQFQGDGYPDNQWFLGIPHAAALLAASAACLAQLWMLERGLPRARATAFGLAMGILVVAATPDAPFAFLGGSGFLGGDPWLSSISEFQPLLFGPGRRWWVDLSVLGAGFFFTAAMLAVRSWRHGGRAILAAFALGYAFAALSSARFLAIAAPLCAVSGAIAVSDLRRKWSAALGSLAIALLIVPSLAMSVGRVFRPAPAITPAQVPLVRAAEFLRDRLSTPGRVLGPWSWGHLFNVVGGRAVLLDNFGTAGGEIEFENGTAATLATREKAVADYCAARQVRFVVLQDPLPYFAAQAAMSGFPRSAYERPAASDADETAATPLMKATFWWRAYFEGGRKRPGNGPAGAAFRHFRLARVEAESQPSESRSAVQIWELDPASADGR